MNVDIYSDELLDNIELNNIGFLIALTVNNEINQYAIDKFKNQFGENGAYRLPTAEELDACDGQNEELFSHISDFISLTDAIEEDATIYEDKVETVSDYESIIKNEDINPIPLFIKYPNNKLDIISNTDSDLEKIKKGTTLVYLKREAKDMYDS